jgi:hypothetical protein
MINHPNRSKSSTIAEEAAEAAMDPPQPPAEGVQRSFEGIRMALFDEWDRLRNGQTTADNAKACARMADVILSSVETQLEALKYTRANSGSAQLLLK